MLGLFTILCVGIMTGNEFAVSAFVNPAIWQLDQPAQARAASLFARSLGKVMPIWYALSLVLLIAEAIVRRHSGAVSFLYAAVALLALSVVFSIGLLVPINNRIARLETNSPDPRWREDHKRWDNLHRIRIAMLVAALALLVWSVTSAP
jgi:uncharacterized membrane protein